MKQSVIVKIIYINLKMEQKSHYVLLNNINKSLLNKLPELIIMFSMILKWKLNNFQHLTIQKIKVINQDCLEAGLHLKFNLSLNPCVLNMASRNRPGGGYLRGAGAQEENLFRRTNYFQSLEDSDHRDFSRKWSYPLEEFSGVYSPEVFIIRQSEQNGYALLPQPLIMSFIAVSAYSQPRVVGGDEKKKIEPNLAPKFADKTIHKIRIILYIALMNGHDSIVLSAFGCGAFRNPPTHMANLFHQVLHEPCFLNKFKCVTFAIFDDHNAHHFTNPNGNFLPFQKVFDN